MAVKESGDALAHAAQELRGDREVVLGGGEAECGWSMQRRS